MHHCFSAPKRTPPTTSMNVASVIPSPPTPPPHSSVFCCSEAPRGSHPAGGHCVGHWGSRLAWRGHASSKCRAVWATRPGAHAKWGKSIAPVPAVQVEMRFVGHCCGLLMCMCLVCGQGVFHGTALSHNLTLQDLYVASSLGNRVQASGSGDLASRAQA